MLSSSGRLAYWSVSRTAPCLDCSRRSSSTGSECVRPPSTPFASSTTSHHPTAHFSENWGFVALSPMIGGNIFSLAFGRNLDGHTSDESNLPPTTSPDTTIHAQCMDGVECYIWSLKLTTWACLLALGLAVLAGYKDWKNGKEEEKDGGYRPVSGDDS